MRVAIHIKNNTEEHLEGRRRLEEALCRRGVEIVDGWDETVHSEKEKTIDFMISIGGDGTLLSAVHKIGQCGIPVVGVNFGHLGFLTTAGREDIDKLVDCLCEGQYTIEPRTMLEVTIHSEGSVQRMSALNEVYLHRQDQSPLMHTRVWVDGELAATYAADGLIVATPTGSTAYSLSCGGPILMPDSGSIVLTPIAAHTLTQRPVILSDRVNLCLREVEEESSLSKQTDASDICDRSMHYTLGVDSYVCTLPGDSMIEIRKADYNTQLLRIEQQNFFSAIREKLMWGR